MKLNRIAGVLLTTFTCLSSALEAADMTSTKLNGCNGPVLCSSFPLLGNCDDCCYTMHLDVGLLYQQPSFPGNSPGESFVPSWQQTATSFYKQDISRLNVCMDYTLGLTVSAGYLMKHDQWFIGAKFDWLNGTTNATYNETNTVYVASPLLAAGRGADDDGIFTGSGFDPHNEAFDAIYYDANIEIYSLDVTLSRGSYLSRCFSYEPWMGVEAVWFSTSTTATYEFANATSRAADLNIKFNNWGAGPAFGFNGEYYITEGLSLFSDSNLAVLIGKVDGVVTSTLTPGSSGADPNIISSKDPSSCAYMVPVRSIIGIKLSTFCLEDKHYVALKLGFDARVLMVPAAPTGFSTNGLYADLIWAF